MNGNVCMKGNIHFWICTSNQSIGNSVKKVNFTFQLVKTLRKWILKGECYQINWNDFSDKIIMVIFTNW